MVPATGAEVSAVTGEEVVSDDAGAAVTGADVPVIGADVPAIGTDVVDFPHKWFASVLERSNISVGSH